MEEQNENLDSPNEEQESVNSENDGQSEQDNSKKEEPEFSDREKQLFERAKNNEEAAKILRKQGYERKDGKWEKPEPLINAEKSQSNEPDYAKLAFLEQRGITHPDDQKLVQDEAARLKLPMTDILGMEYVKAKLEAAKDQRGAQEGMPKGRGKASTKTVNDVDYWLAKGETPDDLEMAEKVINARIQKHKNTNMFSDELYTG